MKVHLNIIFSTGKFLYSYTNNKKHGKSVLFTTEYFFRKIWKFIILFFGTSIKFNNFVENYKRRVA